MSSWLLVVPSLSAVDRSSDIFVVPVMPCVMPVVSSDMLVTSVVLDVMPDIRVVSPAAPPPRSPAAVQAREAGAGQEPV